MSSSIDIIKQHQKEERLKKQNERKQKIGIRPLIIGSVGSNKQGNMSENVQDQVKDQAGFIFEMSQPLTEDVAVQAGMTGNNLREANST